MSKRLEQLSDRDPLFPVQAFFNALGDRTFVDALADLLRGVGHGVNEAHCEFPGDLDPGEPRFEGVRFRLFEDEVVVSRETFERFLLAACRAQAQRCPEQRAAIAHQLAAHGLPLSPAPPAG